MLSLCAGENVRENVQLESLRNKGFSPVQLTDLMLIVLLCAGNK